MPRTGDDTSELQRPSDDIDIELAALLGDAVLKDLDYELSDSASNELDRRLSEITVPLLQKHKLIKPDSNIIDRLEENNLDFSDDDWRILDANDLQRVHEDSSPDSVELVDEIAKILARYPDQQAEWVAFMKDLLGESTPYILHSETSIAMIKDLGTAILDEKEHTKRQNLLVDQFIENEMINILPAHDDLDEILARVKIKSLVYAEKIGRLTEKDLRANNEIMDEITSDLDTAVGILEDAHGLDDSVVEKIKDLILSAAYVKLDLKG